jgi:hypothetical protein
MIWSASGRAVRDEARTVLRVQCEFKCRLTPHFGISFRRVGSNLFVRSFVGSLFSYGLLILREGKVVHTQHTRNTRATHTQLTRNTGSGQITPVVIRYAQVLIVF